MFDRFTMEDRVVMVFAMQEAQELGHRGLGNDHLILGMLGNARSPLFALLGEQGLTLETAREAVVAYHAEHADDEAAQAEAGTAADRYEEDREALASIGIDLDKVRAAVNDRFGDDLSANWGERPRRGRGRGDLGRGDLGRGGRGRGHDNACADGRRHHRGRGRGPGFGPGGFGPGGFGPGEGGPWDGPFEGGRGRRGPRGRGGRPRMGSATREAMRSAIRLARERGDRSIRPEYLLLGILDAGDAASRTLIESATTVDALREAVLASLPEAPAHA